MLKRRDAFLKKSALAVSVALLLSSQAQAQAQAQAHKTLTELSTGIIWIDNGTQSLERASVIDRNGNA
ncbi:TPA: immunoglobulin-binding protein, partial [Escherichia coli]